MDDFQKIFISESREELDQICNLILNFENNPDKHISDELMRLFHTLKGNSRLLNLNDFSNIAHLFENTLLQISEGKAKSTKQLTDSMLQVVDLMRKFLKGFENGDIIKLNPKDIANQLKSAQPKPKKVEEGQIDLEGIRVSAESLNKLLRGVGELKAKLTFFRQLIYDFDKQKFKRTLNEADYIVKVLQKLVLKERMYPLKRLFNRYPRMVRQISQEQGKKVAFEVNSSNVMLDRSVTDVIHDPLVHILRNSLDHGIEQPKERLAANKPELGTIKLNAHKEGESVVIRVEDDGKGIDHKQILKKGVELGYITEKEASKSSKEEALRLLFKTGFSTAEKQTKLSGRGVGMDIVWRNLNRIGGNVRISTKKGAGTSVELRLPVTIALVNALNVIVGNHKFEVPLLRVLSIEDYEKNPIIKGTNVQTYVLGELLAIPDNNPSKMLIYEYQNEMIGIGVDDVLYEEQILLEKPNKRLGSIRGVGGSTIKSDGTVEIVLDVDSLLEVKNNGNTQIITKGN